MSCRNFEVTITELARGQMLEASAKTETLAHLKECRHCAARFNNEQSLTAGLHAVKANAVLNEMPAQAEAALLSAFRQQRAAIPFQPAISPAITKKVRWPLWSLAAAAAVILVVSTLTIPRFLSASKQPAQSSARIGQPVSQPAPVKKSEEFERAQANEQAMSGVENPEPVLVNYPAPRPLNRRREMMRPAILSESPVHTANNAETVRADEEIATDFLPLTDGGSLSQLEGGQVVRVELPRSALQSFGLPMNAERAGERVKADVLLGHDGIARAIRFVR